MQLNYSKKITRSLSYRVLCTMALSLMLLISSFGSFATEVIAAPSQIHLMALFGSSRAEQLDDIAKTDIDKTFGAGTSNQAEGAVKQAQGKAEKDLQKTQGVLKGAKGKAKQDIGRTQSAIGNVEKNIDSAAEDAQDAVKGLLN